MISSANMAQAEPFHLSSPITYANEYGGIGVIVEFDDEELLIDEIFENSRAEIAGLLVGDIIIAIDGIDCDTVDFDQAIEAIRGPAGTSVALTILRDDEELTFTVERQTMTDPDEDDDDNEEY
jgi:carboxyl-terminal processing protease